MRVLLALAWLCSTTVSASPHVDEALREWREQGGREGWTFEVGETPLMHVPESLRYGYDASVNAAELSRVRHVRPDAGPIPPKWDWRDQGVVSSIKDQAKPQYCGSCWAFGTVAVVESLVKMVTGKDLDLAEQPYGEGFRRDLA